MDDLERAAATAQIERLDGQVKALGAENDRLRNDAERLRARVAELEMAVRDLLLADGREATAAALERLMEMVDA